MISEDNEDTEITSLISLLTTPEVVIWSSHLKIRTFEKMNGLYSTNAEICFIKHIMMVSFHQREYYLKVQLFWAFKEKSETDNKHETRLKATNWTFWSCTDKPLLDKCDNYYRWIMLVLISNFYSQVNHLIKKNILFQFNKFYRNSSSNMVQHFQTCYSFEQTEKEIFNIYSLIIRAQK